MTGPDAAGDGVPTKRRAPWSFKHLVEDVAGKPISEFQDPPGRPTGSSPPMVVRSAASGGGGASLVVERPHVAGAVAPPSPAQVPAIEVVDPAAVVLPAAAADTLPEGGVDPVARVYPPLAGSTGRALHGADAEHHAPTLESVRGPEERNAPGVRTHGPGPSRRPERIYLHYLLLHLDRLNDGALRYLKHAVDEEFAHREPRADDA